jgi:hypothetical protein
MSAHERIRYFALPYSAILALLTIWLFLAEISRAALPWFPADRAAAAAAASSRSDAKWAARFGLVRGALWTEYALTYVDLFWPETSGESRASLNVLDQARLAAERAVTYSPHEARAWLLLAVFELRSDPLKDRSAMALKMSYYTGPNEAELTPMRLFAALQPSAIGDEEVRQLASAEIRAMLAHRPELKSAIGTAYRDAPPPGKRFLEAPLAALDPDLLSSMRGGDAPRR